MFQLHPQLSKDTYPLRAMPLCRLLLMNDARYPWIILVPEKPDLVEITDLGEEDYLSLMKEVRRATKVMKQLFQADKMNVAMLGNMVPQLHVHIIGRLRMIRPGRVRSGALAMPCRMNRGMRMRISAAFAMPLPACKAQPNLTQPHTRTAPPAGSASARR